MSCEKAIYAVPMKCRGNDYIRIAKNSQKDTNWTEPAAFSYARIPLMMADGSNTTSSNGYRNRGNRSDTRNVVYGNTDQEFPSLPGRKKPPRSYIKEAKNTPPVAIPNGKAAKFGVVSQTHPHDNSACVEQSNSDGSQEVFEHYESNGYLTPTDPPPYVDSCLDYSTTDFPSSSIGSETSTNSIHTREGKPFQRFDSGVADCESVRGSSSVPFGTSPTWSTNSVSSPRLSTQYEQQYEDIDQYHRTHDQQQQQQQHVPQRRSTEKLKTDSVRNGQPRLPKVNISGVTNSDSEDNDLITNLSMAGISSHPIHDPRTGSLPHTYMPLNATKHPMELMKPRKTQRISCWIVVSLVFILVISLTALGLSLYVLVSKPETSESTALEHSENISITEHSDFDSIVSNLQQKVDHLIKENAALKEALLHQENNLTFFIEQKVTELSAHQANLSSTLQLMEGKFDTEIANISLTPGAQGPPGVANFSLCVTKSILRSAPASPTALTETSYLPSDTDLQKYFVTFAYCTYEGATGAHLETQLNTTTNRYKYRCRCWGQVPGPSQTLCKTIIWMCPAGN